MIIWRGISPHWLYRHQLNALLNHGDKVTVMDHVSGQEIQTRELLDVATVIDEPQRRVHMVPGRFANPFLALSESIWLLAGRNDIAVLKPYNSRIDLYSDDKHTLYDAYGFRIKDQILDLINRLKANPSDRRAVFTIWTPADLTAETKSPPCNDLIAFKLREGKLHMTVFCRSNDLHWGLYAVNLCQFSILQEYIATRLRVAVGQQTHISNSLHIYTEGPAAKINERMQEAESEGLPELPDPQPLFPAGLPRHDYFVASCNDVLEGGNYGFYGEGNPLEEEGIKFLEFASDFLRCYRERRNPAFFLEGCRHADYYADWTMAGKQFLEFINKKVAVSG